MITSNRTAVPNYDKKEREKVEGKEADGQTDRQIGRETEETDTGRLTLRETEGEIRRGSQEL